MLALVHNGASVFKGSAVVQFSDLLSENRSPASVQTAPEYVFHLVVAGGRDASREGLAGKVNKVSAHYFFRFIWLHGRRTIAVLPGF
jgi:hypothetical protein